MSGTKLGFCLQPIHRPVLFLSFARIQEWVRQNCGRSFTLKSSWFLIEPRLHELMFNNCGKHKQVRSGNTYSSLTAKPSTRTKRKLPYRLDCSYTMTREAAQFFFFLVPINWFRNSATKPSRFHTCCTWTLSVKMGVCGHVLLTGRFIWCFRKIAKRRPLASPCVCLSDSVRQSALTLWPRSWTFAV